MMLRSLASGLALLALPLPALPQDASDNARLVGTWILTDPATQCTEIYDFRRDGIAYIVSGDERSESSYALSAKPGAMGRHRLTVTMHRYHGGKDCSGIAEDTTGKPNTSYVMFFPGGRLIAVCMDETSDERCFGPLQKLNR
jgi:hypothetical protein